MRICFLGNAAVVHTQRWAKYFSARGYDVVVVSLQKGEIENVRVLCLTDKEEVSRLEILRLIPKVRRVVRELMPDVVHAHYVTSYGIASAFANWHPLVMTAWGSDIFITPEGSFPYRCMVRWALHRADLVTSMAEHMTDFMLKRRYCSSRKLITLPFGVDTDAFVPSLRNDSRVERPPVVISTRHLTSQYDVKTLVRAIPNVVSKHPTASFLIVGDGNQRAELERMVVKMGVAASVKFLGRMSHHEMPQLLGSADVFVTTSLSDGNNVSLNEAMACGAFPIASDIPANREWLSDQVNGLLFPVGDSLALSFAIDKALVDHQLRQSAHLINTEIIQTRGSWQKNVSIMEGHYLRITQLRNWKFSMTDRYDRNG